jgi:hypothetical protein
MTIYDTTSPASAATSPAQSDQFDFAVEWTGGDTAVGSGVAYYDIQVKLNDGGWTDWITRTTNTNATFTATPIEGQTEAYYHFRSRATDNAGHVEDWPAAENWDTTTWLRYPGTFPGKYKIRLPIMMRGSGGAQLPDLVVTDIAVVPANPAAGYPVDVAVTLKNQGNADANSCFWIDVYINPAQLPITVNMGWFEAGSEGGLVWWYCKLNAGQSTTLHYLNDTRYRADLSRFDGRFAVPRTYNLYAQVDSYDLDTNYGVVYESNEQNNVLGPHPVVVGGTASSTSTLGVMAAPPARPNVPPGESDR